MLLQGSYLTKIIWRGLLPKVDALLSQPGELGADAAFSVPHSPPVLRGCCAHVVFRVGAAFGRLMLQVLELMLLSVFWCATGAFEVDFQRRNTFRKREKRNQNLPVNLHFGGSKWHEKGEAYLPNPDWKKSTQIKNPHKREKWAKADS